MGEGKEPKVRDMPHILRYHGRRRAAACICILLLLASMTAACATPRPPMPTSTRTVPVVMPTATNASLTDLPQLPLPPAGAVADSLDGTRLAVLDLSLSTVMLYDLAGTVYGQYHDPAGGPLVDSWLADSSGIFITGNDHSAHMQIMDRTGTLHPTAFDAVSGPLLSPDGRWIAGTLVNSSSSTQDVVEIGPRSGASIRRLQPGSDFLGWLDGQVAYTTNGAIYLAPPAGGSAHLIASVPVHDAPREVVPAAAGAEGEVVSSPDDQVLIVQVHDFLQMLTSTGLAPLPIHVIQTLSVFWAGPHTALGAVGANGAVEVIDMLTGATIQKTPAQLAGNQPEAVSGNWIATIEFGQPAELFVINDQTGASEYLGLLPPSGPNPIVPLGSHGQFLVTTFKGPTYLASAT